MNKLINRYYITTFISELARTIPHPVLTILLIEQKGLNLAEITFVQIFFFLGILLFEVPSGIIADKGYRKSGYVLALVCLLVSYTMIFINTNLVLLCIAWFIYGIATALISGNIDGYIVNLLKEANEEDKIKSFNIKRTNTSLIAGIFGAMIGSLAYPLISSNIYIISITLYIISILVCVATIKIKHSSTNQVATTSKVKINWTSELKQILILVCVIELYYIGFYQYWQVLYQAKGIPIATFGIIYMIFSVTVILSNKLYGKVSNINDNITLPLFIIASVASIFFTQSIVFCIIYPVTLFIANLYVIDIYTRLYEVASPESISSVISIISTSNRIFGMVILGVITIVINIIDLSVILIVLYLSFAILFYTIRFNKQKGVKLD